MTLHAPGLFLGLTRWASGLQSLSEGPQLMFSLLLEKWAEWGPRREPPQGSVAEGSKALDLGSSLFGGVGSNPTAASSGFKEGQTA